MPHDALLQFQNASIFLGNLPIHLVLELVASLVEAGKLFFGAVKRAKSLELHGMEGFPWKEIKADIRSGETLETLSLYLKLPDNDDGDISAISKIWSPSPSLRNLTWSAGGDTVSQEHVEHFKGLNFPFQALTFLELNDEIEVKAFYYILSLTPSLVTAKFDSVEGELDYEVIEEISLSFVQPLETSRYAETALRKPQAAT